MTLELATRLKEHILLSDLKAVKELLSGVNTASHIKEIETTFPDTDPVNIAISCRDEAIAIYLVEKGFSTDKIYQSSSKRCDQWCYSKHEDQKCPAEYDAADKAAAHKMHKLKEIIDAIRTGRRQPGDGLHDAIIITTATDDAVLHPHPPANGKPQMQRHTIPRPRKEKPKSAANEAMVLLHRYGEKFVTKNGWTLLHRVATSTPAHVYVMANNGVPINVQNSAGDTALHVAVKANNFDVCEALLQCCADLTIRNKMGQTPLDMAEGPIKELLQKAEPGAIGAFMAGRSKRLARILPAYWCGYQTIVKDGMSLVQLAVSLADDDPKVSNCCRILHDYRLSSELVHSVLAEDMAKLHQVLVEARGISVNVRFRDRYGQTLLSHAINSNNIEVVKILVNAGAKVDGIRVRDKGQSNETVPLFHKTLKKDLDPEIPRFIHSVQQPSEMMEKDHNGNTALLRAVEEGASDRTIDWLLLADDGLSLTHRNKNGMNARELAVSKGRSDIVQMIDKFVLQQRGKFFLVKLPVNFYGMDNLQFTDEQLGKTLLEVVEEGKDSDDIKSLRHYSEIEARGIQLFEAAANGDLKRTTKLNVASFQDKNGYTGLIRAIVFNQLEIVKYLCVSRPVLRSMPDNSNRYPLHYACALPEDQGREIIRVLLERKAEDIDKRMDKDGLFAAEYMKLRGEPWALQMLWDARTLDAYGREGPPLAPLPEGAQDFPPKV